jgi:hypothetical protein
MRYDKSSYHRGMFLTSYPAITKSDPYQIRTATQEATTHELRSNRRAAEGSQEAPRRNCALGAQRDGLNASNSIQKARSEMPRATTRRRSNE